MKYFFLCTFCIAAIVFAQAQEATNYSLNKLEGSVSSLATYEEISGTPFIYEQFNNGMVYLESQENPVNYKLNYNAFHDQIEYIENGITYIATNPNQIKRIVVNNETLVYTKYYNFKELKKGYFIEIINDYISLYRRETASVMLPENTAYSSSPRGEFLHGKPMYYLSIYGEPLHLLKSKKKLLELLFNNEDLKKFLKEEKIKFHLEEDLKKLVTFLNNYDKR